MAVAASALLDRLEPRRACGYPFPYAPHPKQRAMLLMTGEREVFFGGSAGPGKALQASTPILTTACWSSMAELRVGDEVFGPDGLPTRVVAVSPIALGRQCYRLTFADGATLVADKDHVWRTFNELERSQYLRLTDEFRAARRAKRPSTSNIGAGQGKAFTREHREYLSAMVTARNKAVVRTLTPRSDGTLRTTTELAATVKQRRGRANHSIPLAAPIELPEADLPLDPYVLGAWLGDGTASGAGFTTADPEMLDEIRAAGWPVERAGGPASNQYGYKIGTLGKIGGVGRVRNDFTTALRDIGVLDNKHVPAVYLTASRAQRLALLQGLMDTDGTADTDGGAQFGNTNERLAEAVYDLALSLGLKPTMRKRRAKLYGIDCGPQLTVSWTAALACFRLPRKLARLKTTFRATQLWRHLVEVEPVASVPVRCIEVARPDGMFLAGRHLIATHNSSLGLFEAMQYVCVPGYASLLMRQTSPQLHGSEGLVPRSHEWFSAMPGVEWRAEDMTWTFAGLDGRPAGQIRFGHAERDQDRFKFSGHAYHHAFFDELTQWATPAVFEFIGYSRMRKPEQAESLRPCPGCGLTLADVPLRLRGAGNPGGLGHNWVRGRYGIQLDGGCPEGRRFMPARLRDNPSINAEQYSADLRQMNAVEAARLLEGDWEVTEGGRMFRRAFFLD